MVEVILLNCARGEDVTQQVFSNALSNPNLAFLLLQEPHLNPHHQPHHLEGFEVFAPTQWHPKCCTYIRKSFNFKPTVSLSEADCFLGISVHTPTTSFHIFNLYSPGRPFAAEALLSRFTAPQNSLLLGDLNCHHPLWYGDKSADHHLLIANHQEVGDSIVDHLHRNNYTLINDLEDYTHFPRDHNKSPTIIDLAFASGKCWEMTSGYHIADLTTSDHKSITLHLQLSPNPEKPSLNWKKTDWPVFSSFFATLPPPNILTPNDINNFTKTLDETLT